MSRDQLLILRPFSKGTLAAAEVASLTVNQGCVPPGSYDIEIQYGAATGTATGITVQVMEAGKLLAVLPVNNQAAMGPLVDPRSRTLTVASAPSHAFIRGVVIRRWNDGQPNIAIDVALVGGTISMANLQVTVWPDGRAPQFNSTP